ncbi:MAG: c-type cytochrome [Alphaproteobacteria bacterium]
MMKTIAAALTALALTGMADPALAGGDAAAGEKIFKKCKACHKVGDGAKNGVGPMLNGIIGNEIASVEGFEKKYSKAFMAKKDEGLVWTDEVLDAYLTKPKAYIKGTKMSFPGLKKEADRANVIAYLLSFE